MQGCNFLPCLLEVCGAMVHFVAYFCLWLIDVHSAPGVPIAWMLLSSGTEVMSKYFLNFVKLQSLQITPAIIMTNCDKAQMNVITAVYLVCYAGGTCSMQFGCISAQKNSQNFGNMSENGLKLPIK